MAAAAEVVEAVVDLVVELVVDEVDFVVDLMAAGNVDVVEYVDARVVLIVEEVVGVAFVVELVVDEVVEDFCTAGA